MRRHAPLRVASRLLLAGLITATLAGCADRQRRNPLDPEAERPLDLFDGLAVVAEDERVRLKWDLQSLTDLDGLRIYREGGPEGPQVFEIDPATVNLTDEDVTNGVVYRYRLSMLVRDEGEVFVGESQLATPGPEISWLADRGSGLVWRLSPDGRAGLFAQGRFPSIEAIAVDGQTGDCWVSDRRFRSLHRIDGEGEVHRIGVDLEAGGDLRLDTSSRIGWIADRLSYEVFSFSLDETADTLQLTEIDATFRDEVQLAVQSGRLWVADPAGERVLLYDAEGERVASWTGLPGLTAIDASMVGTAAWVLADGGQRLFRLESARAPVEVFMPFIDPAVALDAGDIRGDVWVAGPTDVVAYTDAGVPLLHWDNVPGTRDVAVDERNQYVWIASATQLWKVSLLISYQTHLSGFTETLEVVVDAGGG